MHCMNDRIWCVVNLTTKELLYSSFQWSLAKISYDHFVKFYQVGDRPLFDIKLQRFDLNSSYRV